MIEENTEHDIDTLSASIISELIEYMVHDTFQDDIALLIAEVVDRSETSTL